MEETLGVAKQHLLMLELVDMAKGRGHPENRPHRLRLCRCGVPSKMCPSLRPLAWNLGEEGQGEQEPRAHARLPQEPEEPDRCREESGCRGGKRGRRRHADVSPESRRPCRRMRDLSTTSSPQPGSHPAAVGLTSQHWVCSQQPYWENNRRGSAARAGPRTDRQTDGQGVFPAFREFPQPGCSDRAGRPPPVPGVP